MTNRVAQVLPIPLQGGMGVGERDVSHPQVQVIHVTDPAFPAGFQKAILDFELKYKQQANDDTGIAMINIMAGEGCDHSDMWKAGYQAGFFAALYGTPYSWRIHPTQALLRYRINSRRRAG